MFRSPLLETPLPQPTRPLPDIYTIRSDVTNRDETRIGVRGLGSALVPRMVQEAIEEVVGHYHRAGREEQQMMEAGWHQMILVLTCRYEERGYVEYEPVPSSATPSQSAASGIA